jgi:hypothetical protein
MASATDSVAKIADGAAGTSVAFWGLSLAQLDLYISIGAGLFAIAAAIVSIYYNLTRRGNGDDQS